MQSSYMRIGGVSYRRYGVLVVVGLLCMCVCTQMLGLPGTLIDLLTSSDTLVESVSEDSPLTPVVPEPETSGSSRLLIIGQSTVHLPVFVTSVFHPPQA
ncbi:MAG: hypothetical protein H8K03_19880 [Nitrospira sp.]